MRKIKNKDLVKMYNNALCFFKEPEELYYGRGLQKDQFNRGTKVGEKIFYEQFANEPRWGGFKHLRYAKVIRTQKQMDFLYVAAKVFNLIRENDPVLREAIDEYERTEYQHLTGSLQAQFRLGREFKFQLYKNVQNPMILGGK